MEIALIPLTSRNLEVDEITQLALDQSLWLPAQLDQLGQESAPGGKFWSWRLWNLEVDTSPFARETCAVAVVARASEWFSILILFHSVHHVD